MKARKYVKGPAIWTIGELVNELAAGRYVIWNDKPMHPAWMTAMQLSSLVAIVGSHRVFFANINPDWIEQTNAPETAEVAA